jgi:glycine/D-amino acid oxidase-like deaminating enzyme
MMGTSLAPATGRLVTEMITGQAPSYDTALLRPDRFGG